MPDKEWEKTQRGQTQKKLDNLRYKWRKRGFKVDIAKDSFHNKYMYAKKCQVCNKRLGNDRVAMVGEVALGETILLSNIFIVHQKCQKEHVKVGAQVAKKRQQELSVVTSKKCEKSCGDICPHCGHGLGE
jgi:hypothetical protein